MSDAYEPFLIPVEVIGGKNAESTLQNIDNKLKEISENLIDVGYGADAMKMLTANMKDLSSASRIVASGITALNKANADAAKYAENVALAHQKVITEAEKTAKAHEQAKVAANNVAIADQKLQTEMQRTAAAHLRAEMASLRLSQAQEKQAAAARQAASPYNQLNQQLREQAQKLQDAIVAGNLNDVTIQRMADRYNRLNTKLTEAKDRFKELTNVQDKNRTLLEILKTSFGTFLGMLANNALMKATQMMKDFAASISRAGIEMDALQNTMLAATGGWETGGREIKWIIDMSNRLGLSFGDVSDSYAKFMTSFTRSGGTITQSRQIFEDLSTAMVSLHLPAERMQGVFVALEQMANKGTVQAEELKRQLGNALPGAFELAAESMGILPAKLMDMMKAGEVFSKDFLPAFAATVKAALGQSIDIASMQFNASINRLATATDLLKMNIGQMANEALLPLVNALVVVTNAMAKTAQFFNENATAAAILKGALTGLLATVVAFNWSTIVTGLVAIGTAIRATLIPAIGALIKELLIANAELAGLPLIIGAIVTALAALGYNLADTAKKAGDFTPYIGLSQQIVNLTKEVAALDTTTEEGREKLEEYKQNFPELTEYLAATGKKFEELTDEELKHIAVLGDHDAKMRVLSERTKELASWQSTFAAVCQVAWDKICVLGKAMWQTLYDVFKAIGDGVKWLFKLLGQAISKVSEFQKNLGVGMQAVGKALHNPFIESYGKILEGSANLVLNFDENMQSLKNTAIKVGTAIKENWENSAFVADINAKKIDNANKNALKKLEVIQKNSKMTYDALKQAQSATTGLTAGGDEKGKKGKKGKTAKEKKQDDAWEALNKEMKATEELMRVRLLNGKSIADLEPKYARLREKHDQIEAAMRKLTETQVTGWDRIKKEAEEATKVYQYRLANSTAYTASEIEQAKQLMKNLNAEVRYQEVLKKREDILQITNREASKLANTLIDGLLDFDSELSVWDRFKDTALSAIKAVAASWIKEMGNSVLAGWQAGWAKNGSGNRFVSALLGAGSGFAGTPLEGTKDKPTYTGTGALNGAFGGIQKAWQTVKSKFGWGGTATGGAAAITGDSETGSILSTLTTQATSLSDTLLNATNPAITNTISNFGGMANSALSAGMGIMNVANPAVIAAGSIASMATAAPIAAAGVGAMAGVMKIASTTFTKAAPALISMAGAMAALAASAATASTSMAALAVATAAESVAKIPYVGGFLAPVAALATGAGIAAGTIMTGAGIAAGATIAGAGQMLGSGMAGIGNKLSGVSSAKVVPHAKGGIVSSPTMFPMQGGNLGLAGEAGTEVIAPAKRMANGEVGIGAVAPQVTVNNYTNAAVEVKKRPDNSMEIKISELNSMLSSSKTNRGMSAAQGRMQRQGRQIG